MAREECHLITASVCCSFVFSPTDNDKNQQLTSIREKEEVCSTMEGSTAISGTAAPTGVTSFANEACEGVQVNSDFVSSSIALAQSDLQDIKSYFARPRLGYRGVIPYGTRDRRFGDAISTNRLPDFFPQWLQRLSGAFGIRFKLNFRLQVAATPFHQGVVTMSYQYGTTGLDNMTQYYNRSRNSHSVTNLPHVRLDLAEGTMAELSVPFLHDREFTQVALDPAQLGYFAFNVVLPLVSVTGLPAPTYEIYIYLTDVELFGADNNAPSTITLQSGLSTFGAEAKQARLLSKGLDGVAKVSNFVARNIPSLAALAGPVSWVAGTMSGVAKYFGYSRPLLQDPVMRVVQQQYTSESNVDVPMAGFACGLMQSNTLEISPEVGGTNIDEMSLDFITSQWSQVCIGKVATTNTHNQPIYAAPLSPSAMWFRAPATAPFCNIVFPGGNTVGATWNAIMPSSLMNIASYFRLWRGDFKFRITFAKTKFHGGRYMISYNPSTVQRAYAGVGIPTVEGPENMLGLTQPYGYSKIMDLRDGNVFEFEIPYMSPEPFVSFCSSTGGVSIVCIDPLLDNPSVCSSVPFLVEVCGSNFELADFAGPWFSQFTGGFIREQSGEVVMGPTTKMASAITIGERILSAKQLIQSPTWFVSDIPAGQSKFVALPWFYNRTTSYLGSVNSTPLAPNVSISGNTTAASLAKMYAFVRGGTDHHFYTPYGDKTALIYEQSPQETYIEYANVLKNTEIRQSTASTPKVVAAGNTPLHIRAPAFQNRVRIKSTILDANLLPVLGNATAQGFEVRGHTDRVTVVNGATTQPLWYSKAASDDAMMVHYQGPIPLAILNTAQATFPEQDWYRAP